MAVYRYRGIRAGSGKNLNGVIEADTERDAKRLLKQRDIYTTEIALEKSGTPSTSYWRGLLKARRKPSEAELTVFTYQLANMLDAGFPLIEALSLVEEQLPVGYLREAVISIRNNVSEGQSFSQALGEYNEYFSSFYINLVSAGEASGALSAVLQRLATTLESRQQLRGKLASALIYPAIMLLTSIGVLGFLLVVVVPNVVQLFADAEQALPLMTQILIAVSQFLDQWGWLLALLLLAACVASSWGLQTEKGHDWLERQLLRLPTVRRLVAQRVSETLALLLESGVTIILALEITAKATGFRRVEASLGNVSRSVGQGLGLSDALQQTGHFPTLDVRMIHSGELSGNLEAMLRRVAEAEATHLQRSIERFMGLLEPVIVLMMGLMVGFVAVAVMLPIFEMNELIR